MGLFSKKKIFMKTPYATLFGTPFADPARNLIEQTLSREDGREVLLKT